jgi:hypothetical protein
MRHKLIALGCALTATLGTAAVTSSAARADTGAPTALQAAPGKPVPQMSVSTSKGGYTYGAKVPITVTIKANTAGVPVKVYAEPVGQPITLIASGNVNAQGKYSPTYSITRTTDFYAVFAGNDANAAAKASRKVTSTAKVTDAVTGSFSATTISGVSYQLFHGSSMLTLKATVAPNKSGECVEPETQQYDAGVGWDADTKYGCDTLDSQSHDTAPFKLSQAVGSRYRIRANFKPSAKDAANLAADGPWVYFEVAK